MRTLLAGCKGKCYADKGYRCFKSKKKALRLVTLGCLVLTNHKTTIQSPTAMKNTLYASLLLVVLSTGMVCAQNTRYGSGAGSSLTTGRGNAFFGTNSGHLNTTGNYNSFVGGATGDSNTSGSANVFMGFASGTLNTTGGYNVFVGMYSGYFNTYGQKNVYLGYRSGFNSRDSYNVYIGYESGYKNTIGAANTFVGYQTGTNNTTGHSNVFVGEKSGFSNTTGRPNTFVGTQSGYQNTTGSHNTFLGLRSGYTMATGGDNTFLGSQSGYNATGSRNTFVGTRSGSQNISGNGNVFVGYNAGYYEAGSEKLYISNSSTSYSPLIYGDFTNKTLSIGYKYTGTTYKLYVPGTIYANSIYTPSDKKFKKDIANVNHSLEKINALHGVTYEFKQMKSDSTARQLPQGKQYGLIAQEVREVLPELVIEDEDGYLAVNYTGMIPVLVEAIKALQTGQDSVTLLQKQIVNLQQENAEIKQQLAEIKTMLTGGSIHESRGQQGVLYQNIPNPAQQTTTIPYEVPVSAREAYLIIRNLLGEEVLRVDHLNKGQGSAEISTTGLKAGTYLYMLIADGRMLGSKKMIVY